MKWVLKFKMVTTNELKKKNKNKNKRNNHKKKPLKISIKDENIVLNTTSISF